MKLYSPDVKGSVPRMYFVNDKKNNQKEKNWRRIEKKIYQEKPHDQ